MNWLAFIASIVGSLAWPGTVLVALLILRKPLRNSAAHASVFEPSVESAREYILLAERLKQILNEGPRAA